jgi:hypothetical protein
VLVCVAVLLCCYVWRRRSLDAKRDRMDYSAVTPPNASGRMDYSSVVIDNPRESSASSSPYAQLPHTTSGAYDLAPNIPAIYDVGDIGGIVNTGAEAIYDVGHIASAASSSQRTPTNVESSVQTNIAQYW